MRLQVRILLLQCTGMSCHRCVWRGQEEKESLSFRAITQPACPHTAQSGVFSLFRTESESDVVSRGPMTAAWKVLPSLPVSKDPSAPAREDILKSTFGRRGSSTLTSAMIVSRSHADVCRQSHQLKARRREERKVQPVECRLCFAEGIRQEVTSGSLTNLSSPRSYRSCIHREVPLRSSRSVVFLDKSLSISLVDLEERRASQPTLYTSTLSFRFGASSCRRFSTDNKPDKTNEGYRRPRAVLGAEHRSGPGSTAGHSGGLLIKQQGRKVTQIAPARGVNSKPAQRHGSTLGLLSFRGPSPSNTRAGRQKGNADEAAFPTRSNFTHRQHDFNTSPVDSRTWAKTQEQAEREEKLITEAQDETCCSHPQLKVDSLDRALKILSLKEALELYRPDFISRSQSRVRRLEQRAKRRRALQDSNPDLMQGLGEDAGRQRRNCTTPDPLSDNLFKPRERSITGREMQRRSRRIYNKLPEVTKKKEEEKKRAVSQTNRLRVEVFKKRLLDQILQR